VRATLLLRRSRLGAAVLELAFAAPVLLVLIGGVVEIGMLMMRQEEVITICREGVMWGAMTRQVNNPPAVATTRIRNSLQAAGFNSTNTTITATLINTAYGKALQVNMSVPYTPFLNIIESNSQLRASATMRLEDN